MRRTLPPASRRVSAIAATLLVGALLVGCSEENDTNLANDPAGESSESTGETEPTPEPEADPAETAPAETAPETAGELPSWAPEILTEGDDVVGLDFSDIDPLSDELLIEQVTTGDGPPLEVGQTITADYFGQISDEPAPFDESFSSSPFTSPIGVGGLIPGWDQGLIGVPVGSRVVMSVPPDLGYGDADNGPIPGGSTLFFVIDIIDAA